MRINTAQAVAKEVRREIKINEPQDGTGFKSHRVLVTFEVLNKDEAKDLAAEGDDALITRVLKSWGDPKKDGKGGFDDESGNPLPFTPETIASLLNTPWISSGLVRGYFDVAYGGKLGN